MFSMIIYTISDQSVERMTVNHDVTGSSPVGGAIKSSVSYSFYFTLYVLFAR